MPVIAIETVTDTWVPARGQIDEILGRNLRLLAEINSYVHESNAKSRDEMARISAQQELYAVIFKAAGKYSRRGQTSVTNEIPIDHDASTPSLTGKQRRSIALVKKWITEDKDEQTRAMRLYMETVDEDREGYRELYKIK